MTSGEERCGCFVIPIEPASLEHYRRQVGARSRAEALSDLAEAIAHSDFAWPASAALVARASPVPALALLGALQPEMVPALRAQASVLDAACRHLRYFDAGSLPAYCARLVEALRARFGTRLDSCRILAIPRGGWLVASWLAYLLGLPAARLHNAMQPMVKATSASPPESGEAPLTLLVDDCLLTGARLLEVLAWQPEREVVVVTLAAPAELCRRLEAQQPQVAGCVVAFELAEVPGSAGELEAWQQRWDRRTSGMARIWIGRTQWPCFAWNEPERWVWNAVAGEPQPAWHLLPPRLCSHGRPRPRGCAVRLQEAGGGGRWRAAAEIFVADLGDELWLGDPQSGRSFRLSSTAADLWRALLANDASVDAVGWLQQRYEAPEQRLLTDLLSFRGDALERGWLIEHG